MRSLFFLALVILISTLLPAQNLLKSRRSSYNTYIYKLTDKEASKIHRKGMYEVDSTYFHTLVLEYPTDSINHQKLESGHYIKTFARGNKQELFYTFVPSFDVKVLNNNTDLCIRVYDLTGTVIENARVKVGLKTLAYDKKTRCYIDRKSNLKGRLLVTVDGEKCYYELNRNRNNPLLRRVYAKTMWSVPLRYVWRPISYVVSLPFDAIISLARGRAYGVINQTKWYFRRIGTKINDWYYRDDISTLHYKGYLVFNKPIFQPGDTVKLKAYLINKKGMALKKDVVVTLNNGTKNIKLKVLKPYYPGAYECSFYLHDSLELKLDKFYTVTIEENDGDDYLSSTFKYEAYELNNVRLELRTDGDKQYAGKPYSIYAKAVDDNDLNVQDARLELSLTTEKVNKLYDNYTFVPDTLWSKKIKLQPSGETVVELPDSVFGHIDVAYKINARMLSSDNKSYQQTRSVNYFFNSNYFEFKAVGDSVLLKYFENGAEKTKQGMLVANDNFGSQTTIGSVTAPCKFPLNAFYSNYVVRYQKESNLFNINAASAGVQCNARRVADSLFVEISNPRKLNLVYNIYRYNTEIYRGSGTELNFKRATNSKQNHYISLRYLWGGKVKEETYNIPYVEKELNVNVVQPTLVYPGQKTSMEIAVTNQAGKPVEGVDLTAYALTRKFKYKPPTLPSFDKVRPTKELINNFRINDDKVEKSTKILNYQAWKTLAEIDSIEYYKFLYPGDSIYTFKYKTKDAITQFAPFVVSDKGEVLPIHVIYIDNRPVYFSWSTNKQPYSFAVGAGMHQIQLRLQNKSIFLTKMNFDEGTKTILSIPENVKKKTVWIEKIPSTLTAFEQQNLKKYIFPYRNNFNNAYAFLQDNDVFQSLSSNGSYSTSYAGPVSGSLKSGIADDYRVSFDHESNFEYEIAPKLVKMREKKDELLPIKRTLYTGDYLKNLSDSVLTSIAFYNFKRIQDNVDYENNMRNRFYYNAETNGRSVLQFTLAENKNLKTNKPLNVVLMRHDSNTFLHVYGGNARTINGLNPGFYKLIFMYPGTSHFVSEYIEVKANGKTFVTINQPDELLKNQMSLTIKELIANFVYEKKISGTSTHQQQSIIHDNYLQVYPYTGEGDIVSGHVYDELNEDIIGANVMVDGTNLGTITDMNGNFKLKVPFGKYLLRIMYIGYEPKTIDLSTEPNINVGLKPNSFALEEVVVVGYGVQRKSTVVGAVSTVSNALQGRVAGVSASKNNQFTIRGISSMKSGANAPVIVIDGMVYTGDMSQLDSALIESLEVLKDENATAIYGAQAANGVIVITSKGNTLRTALAKNNKGASYDTGFMEAASKANTMRSNFSDYAYWQPRLTTDAQGKARFEVTFPDDVTNWQTYVLAMNGKKQSGQTSGSIKSYKPLMAQLAVPVFLTAGDSCNIIGKTLNYLPDTVKVSRQYAINGKKTELAIKSCPNALVDTIALRVPADSLVMQYTLRKEDGYFDGEKRTVPVFPIGLEETKGAFYVLDKDSTIQPQFDASKGKVTLYADANYLDIMAKEAGYLMGYQYNCNEQMASKLIAMLSDRTILKYKNEKLKHDAEINRLIKQLLKNRNEQGLWGWWPGSDVHYEFSAHIMDALMQASLQGFTVDIDKTKLAMNCVSELERRTTPAVATNLAMLRMLKTFECVIDYGAYITAMDTLKNLTVNQRLQLIELKQRCGLKYNSSLLNEIRATTLFGNVYFADKNEYNFLMSPNLQNTLIAYRILRTQNKPDSVLAQIRRYLLESKKDCGWWNTYETAQILQTVLPDIMKNKTKWEKAELVISGDVNQTVTKFPFQLSLTPDAKISISKKGFDAVYLTTYQREWNKKPLPKSDNFIITTQFENKTNVLEAGKSVKLLATVEVKKDANYVMIKIPIPGGCSYSSKSDGYKWNEYREHFKNETIIYCQKLTKGIYNYEINLIPRFTGLFTLNPAKVELMYFPVFNANNELKTITVK